MITQVEARCSGDSFLLYDLSRHQLDAPLMPTLTIPLPEEVDRLHGFAAHPGLRGAAYATETEVVRLDAAGRVLWRLATGSQAVTSYSARVCCAFSAGGELLWVYLPNAMMDREDEDRLLVVDGAGTVLAQSLVESVGQGASMVEHADGHMLIEIGEGQDGTVILRCSIDGDRLVTERHPWTDRCMIGLSPDGSTFMTVDHSFQADVAFHSYPDGAVLFSLTPADFGEERDEAFIEWVGGYLNARTAVVVLYGEDEDTGQAWHRHELVDLDSRTPTGRWPVMSADVDDIELLGDGTWLQPNAAGVLERHTYSEPG